nr:FCD domain-containing protein [Kineococcus siccus]
MLRASPRVGLVVQAPAHWDVLDPLVIRWRLGGPDREQQLTELRQLRAAVEPAAAAHAAEAVARGGPGVEERARHLAAAADALAAEAGAAGPAFLRADQALHAAVLALAGSATFSRLGEVIAEALRDRALNERGHAPPDPHDVGLHLVLARAIGRGDAAAAAAAVREVVERAVPPA